MSDMSMTGSSRVPNDTPASPPPATAGHPHPTAPTQKRKHGRPCQGESSRGKAPMAASSAPKRARGYIRKRQPFISQYETSPRMVPFSQFYAAHMDHTHRFMIQETRMEKLEKELLRAKEVIDRQGDLIELLEDKLASTDRITRLHQQMFEEMDRWDMAMKRRIDGMESTLSDVVDYMVEHLDFPPSAPPA